MSKYYDKYKKSDFITELLSGNLNLISIEKASLRGIIQGQNRLKSMFISHKHDNGTEINGAEKVGRDVIFYDCRGEQYTVYLYDKRFKSNAFIANEFILVVNFDRADFVSTLFFFKKKLLDSCKRNK